MSHQKELFKLKIVTDANQEPIIDTSQETSPQQDQEAEQENWEQEHGTTNVPDMETIETLP